MSATIEEYALESYFKLGQIFAKQANKKQAIINFKNCLKIDSSHIESLI